MGGKSGIDPDYCDYCDKWGQSRTIFLRLRQKHTIFCISGYMSKYAYQIKGMLETTSGKMGGLRVLVCNANYFDVVDAPVEIFDKDTVAYMQFRLKVNEYLDINRLPIVIQNKLRAPLGRWLDQWVLENFYGDTSKRKSINP